MLTVIIYGEHCKTLYNMSDFCKFYKEEKEISYDDGTTWEQTGIYRKGDLVEYESPDCGYSPHPQPAGSGDYLTFVALEDGEFSFETPFEDRFERSLMSYSLDGGATWSEPATALTVYVSEGEIVKWKNNYNVTAFTYATGIGEFSSTMPFNVEGNAMSIVYGDNFIGKNRFFNGSHTLNSPFYRLFKDCVWLANAENLVLPVSAVTDYCYAEMFKGCTSLITAPELPATARERSWGSSSTLNASYAYNAMFYGCTSLESPPSQISIDSFDSYIYWEMFKGCSSLTETPILLTSGDSCNLSSCDEMYEDCTSLVTISGSSIGDINTCCSESIFNGCTSVTSVTIPDSVTTIGAYSFAECSGLASIIMSSGITSILSNAFMDCKRLTSIDIPSGVTYIGTYTFSGCTSLTSIDIPSGITNIDIGAFSGCTSLTSITVNAITPPTLGGHAFDDTNNCPIYVPSGSVNTYKSGAGANWSSYASRIQAIP